MDKATGKKIILLTEDDESLREIYTQKLESEGYGLLTAVNGEEGVRQIKENYETIDLILLDVVMPKMDGFDVLERIKGSGKYGKIPIIVLTSLGDPADREHAIELGADRFFVKSEHTPTDLAKQVRETLEEMAPKAER